MSEARIGRVLVASLHQAIADVLPDQAGVLRELAERLGLREGTIGLAPLTAVLSFLRTEGEAYGAITARAGRYAAEWTVRGLPTLERRMIAVLPTPLRARAALRAARQLVRSTYPGTRLITKMQQGARRRSTCADRSSARCGSSPRSRCAGSMPPRSDG